MERPVASKYKNASSLWQASVSRYICWPQKFMMKKGSYPINRKDTFIELNTVSRISNVLFTAYTPRTTQSLNFSYWRSSVRSCFKTSLLGTADKFPALTASTSSSNQYNIGDLYSIYFFIWSRLQPLTKLGSVFIFRRYFPVRFTYRTIYSPNIGLSLIVTW